MPDLASKTEHVPDGQAIWQSEHAKSYLCPICKRWIFSQYEGDAIPKVTCCGFMKGHLLEWDDDALKTER